MLISVSVDYDTKVDNFFCFQTIQLILTLLRPSLNSYLYSSSQVSRPAIPIFAREATILPHCKFQNEAPN